MTFRIRYFTVSRIQILKFIYRVYVLRKIGQAVKSYYSTAPLS